MLPWRLFTRQDRCWLCSKQATAAAAMMPPPWLHASRHNRVKRESGSYLFTSPLSVCPLACIKIQKPHIKTSLQSSVGYILIVAVARSFSDDNARRYVLPVLWMTSSFHIMGQIQSIGELFIVTRQVAPGRSLLSLIALFNACHYAYLYAVL